jgi:hypothetical protein
MKKITSFFTLICVVIAFSCSDNAELSKQSSEVKTLTNQIVGSESFAKMNVDVATLNLSAANYSSASKKSIFIPVIGNESKEGIIGMLKDGKLIHVSYFKMETDLTDHEIESSIKEGKFNGVYTLRASRGQVDMQIQNSKITKANYLDTAVGNAREAEPTCGDITTNSGAYACAGARIESMNWFDKTICYASFMVCFAENVVSCYIDGCTVS